MAPTEFELQRQRLIARNRERLQQLGLDTAAAGLAGATTKPKKPRKIRQPKPPQQPTRHSRRRTGEEPEAIEGEAAELASMYIDGVCPKCGGIYEVGIKQHYEKCTGESKQRRRRAVGEPPKSELLPEHLPDEDASRPKEYQDLQQLPEQDRAKLTGKLKELELSGLIDFTEEHAEFAVLGSTGKHYKVTLSDGRRRCQCVDHRVRQHDCKHIRLVLQQLGAGSDPSSWRQAVEKQLDQVAAAGDEAADGGDDNGGGASEEADPPEADGEDPAEEPKPKQPPAKGTKKRAIGRTQAGAAASPTPKRARAAASDGKQPAKQEGDGGGGGATHRRVMPARLKRAS